MPDSERLTHHMDLTSASEQLGFKPPARRQGRSINAGEVERIISAVAGGAMTMLGLRRGSLLLTGLGAAFLLRSAAEPRAVLQKLGILSDEQNHEALRQSRRRGIEVVRSITINKPASELYAFWRNFENLPRIMEHLKSVTVTGDRRTHWIAKGPAGMDVEWDAETIMDEENELIAWGSLEGSDVDHAGSVHFRPAQGNRGTEVLVKMRYNPRAGRVGAALAKLFGEDPKVQIAQDLRRFKMLMETGEIATNAGMPSGRRGEDERPRS